MPKNCQCSSQGQGHKIWPRRRLEAKAGPEGLHDWSDELVFVEVSGLRLTQSVIG